MSSATMPTVRNAKFSYEQFRSTPGSHYFGDNVFATHFMNAMHVIVPLGERFFIRSVKPFAGQVKSEELKKRVKAFITQEALHDREHVRFWQALEEKGYNVSIFADFYQKTAFEMLQPLLEKLFGKKLALSTTVALEHYTALGAARALTPGSPLLESMHSEIRELMLWHAVEEIEHKSVAFDVLKEIDDDYLLRAAGFFLGTFFLNLYGFIGAAIFMAQDKEFSIFDLPRHFNDMAKLMRARFDAENLINLLKYLEPDFHPDNEDQNHLIEPYLKKLEAVS